MILHNRTGHFAFRQFLTLGSDTSFRPFLIQNKMIETPGAKIRQNFGKSNRPSVGVREPDWLITCVYKLYICDPNSPMQDIKTWAVSVSASLAQSVLYTVFCVANQKNDFCRVQTSIVDKTAGLHWPGRKNLPLFSFRKDSVIVIKFLGSGQLRSSMLFQAGIDCGKMKW